MRFTESATLVVATLGLVASCSQATELPDLVTQTPYPADSGTLLVRCGSLIDGVADEATGPAVILVEDGRIKLLASELESAEGIAILDLSDRTCLPGFIDMHTHIMESVDDLSDLRVVFNHTYDEVMTTGRRLAKVTLNAGFTTVRNVGVYYGWTSRELRDEINGGKAIGPRMQVAGVYLTIPGGGGDLIIPGIPEEDTPLHIRQGVARGPDDFRRKARAAVDNGADFLKVIASGAVLSYGGVPGEPEMMPEEIAAVVEVGHAAGLRVAAHAHGAQSIKEAILAGVDSIEHATFIDDEGIGLAIEHDVPLAMDIFPGDWMMIEGRKRGWPEEFLRKTEETTLDQRESFRRAHRAGVPLVFATDAGIYPHGMNAQQFAFMVEWGMTEMEAIKAATSVAAHYLDWDDRIGTIKPGYFADIVAVEGDPLADIHVLERVDTVVKGGLVFKAPADRSK
jgi:imidazolonepropionase-like amidohydrolase